jgi:chromosome segregation ATPase
LRVKDEELLNKSEEMILLKTRIQEFETSLPLIHKELNNTKNKLHQLEKENSQYSATIHELEPKLQYLEPFTQQLQKEFADLEKKKKLLEDENYQYKSSYDLIMNLNNDLNDIDGESPINNKSVTFDQSMMATASSSSTPFKSASKASSLNNNPASSFLLSPPPPPSTTRSNNNLSRQNSQENVLANNTENYLTLSQQHSLWISLPSIRNLNPKLYEKIRTLSQDLYKREIDYQNLMNNYQKLSQDYSITINDLQDQLSLLLLQNNSEKETSGHYSVQLKELEKSLIHYKELTNIMSQFRTIFKSYAVEDSEKAGHGHHGETGGALHRKKSPNPTHEKYIDEIKDYNLPEYLQQLLLSFTQISYAYHETMHSIEAITHENAELVHSVDSLKIERELLEKELKEYKDNYYNKESYFNTQEKHLFSSMEQATELSEKQNSLLMTLEAKVSLFLCF